MLGNNPHRRGEGFIGGWLVELQGKLAEDVVGDGGLISGPLDCERVGFQVPQVKIARQIHFHIAADQCIYAATGATAGDTDQTPRSFFGKVGGEIGND